MVVNAIIPLIYAILSVNPRRRMPPMELGKMTGREESPGVKTPLSLMPRLRMAVIIRTWTKRKRLLVEEMSM
jgi:hypothetical protein